MIKFIADKYINHDIVSQLLEKNIQTNQFTNYGPNVQYLENIIKNKFDVNNKVVIVTNNATSAIHLLYTTINYYNKNKKINWATQAFTFPSSIQGPMNNIKIYDIDYDGGLDISKLDNEINGIVVTNIFGNVTNIKKYLDWKNIDPDNRFIIFDNAATLYTYYNGNNSINYGDGSIISFHHTKPFGFGEGGAIIIDKKYEFIARKLINFGIGLENNKYYSNLGNNFKMSEISAIYIIQYILTEYENICDKHYKYYNYLKNKIKNNNNIKLFKSYHDNIIVPSCFCLLLNKNSDEYKNKLIKNDIVCRKYYYPLKNTPIATDIFNRILCIPCNINMEYKDIDKILNLLNS
jgi:dTDP-4-amino-4,6-dideoxygalactose transaminase